MTARRPGVAMARGEGHAGALAGGGLGFPGEPPRPAPPVVVPPPDDEPPKPVLNRAYACALDAYDTLGVDPALVLYGRAG